MIDPQSPDITVEQWEGMFLRLADVDNPNAEHRLPIIFAVQKGQLVLSVVAREVPADAEHMAKLAGFGKGPPGFGHKTVPVLLLVEDCGETPTGPAEWTGVLTLINEWRPTLVVLLCAPGRIEDGDFITTEAQKHKRSVLVECHPDHAHAWRTWVADCLGGRREMIEIGPMSGLRVVR
jgi:hypothetical protein